MIDILVASIITHCSKNDRIAYAADRDDLQSAILLMALPERVIHLSVSATQIASICSNVCSSSGRNLAGMDVQSVNYSVCVAS